MDKIKVYEAIVASLSKRFETAKWAAKHAHDAAIDEECVAENKYDTFGLEASYLAHGQSQRVLECESDWLHVKNQGVVLFDEDAAVALWGLIVLEPLIANNPIRYLYMSPCVGGLNIKVDDKEVYLVTPSSPVGMALLGKYIGDEVVLLKNGLQIDYEIIRVA